MSKISFKKVSFMVICLCSILVGTVTAVAAADPIVVLSVDFESVTPGELPAGWEGQGRVVQDTAHSGKASLYVEDTDTSWYGDVHLPLIPVKKNAIYELSVASLVSNIASEGTLAIFLCETDVEGNIIQWHYIFLEKSKTWVEYSQPFEVSYKAAAIQVYIYPASFGGNATANCWIDDLKIVEVLSD